MGLLESISDFLHCGVPMHEVNMLHQTFRDVKDDCVSLLLLIIHLFVYNFIVIFTVPYGSVGHVYRPYVDHKVHCHY